MYNIRVGYSCTPFVKMNSTSITDAYQECQDKPSCSMFFDECGKGTDWNYCTPTGTEIQSYMNLHKKGNANVLNDSLYIRFEISMYLKSRCF